MTYTYTISPDDQLILARIEGPVDFVLFRQSLLYTWNHPSYKAEYNTIVDLSDATIKLRTLEISTLIEMLVDRKARYKSKFVLVVNKPFEAALAMIFESKLVQSMPTKTFTKMEDAAKYLDCTEEYIEDLFKTDSQVVTVDEIIKFAVN